MSNVRPPSAREEKCSAKVTLNRSNGAIALALGVSSNPRPAPVLGNRVCASAQGKCLRAGCQSEVSYRRAPVGKANSSVAVAFAPTFLKFRGDLPRPPHVSSSTKVPFEGITHARPAQQMQLRVAAFVRVAHTVAHMNARTETNGYGTVSTHARPTHMLFNQRPNPSIEGTSNSQLRCLSAAPHVKR